MLPQNVKLIVWDLDDTFWQGTLAEGEIEPIAKNAEIVKTLCERGIMASISSKNDFGKAKSKLQEIGVWDYFIFPRIAFSPKGKLVAEILEDVNLRAENVLFIDDLHLNREEVRHFCPGIMVADPAEILPDILVLPQLAGKDDSDLKRLNQYKNLESKTIVRKECALSTEEFLRDCNIRVDIRHDVENEFDRIVELANRTNQLNFTKIRLETANAVSDFRELCALYGVSVGTVHVSDRYGDYGMIGYYVLRMVGKTKELLHFAFSCRTMNMGIEQYVYERLREPACKIVQPVANPIKTFSKIDWIHEGSGGNVSLGALEGDKKLVLIGGCELRQLASLCSSNRAEYVNEVEHGYRIRHDDFGFILSPRSGPAEDKGFEKTFTWKMTNALQFDQDISSASIVIASLFRAVDLDYFKTQRGTWFGLAGDTLPPHLNKLGAKFVRNFWYMPMSHEERMKLLENAFDRIAESAPPDAHLFALGVSTWVAPKTEPIPDHQKWMRESFQRSRSLFNGFLESYCRRSCRFIFVGIDTILQPDDMITTTHFHRRGYLAIARYISEKIAETVKPKPNLALVDALK